MSQDIDKSIKEAEQKLNALRAKKRIIENARIAKEKEQKRRDDTRRKILAGAIVLNEIQNDAELKARIDILLEAKLVKADERKLFNLTDIADRP